MEWLSTLLNLVVGTLQISAGLLLVYGAFLSIAGPAPIPERKVSKVILPLRAARLLG